MTIDMGKLLTVKNICKKDILHDVSFEMTDGEMVAIMGPSGSGKSTLLYNVSGMDQADSGEVWLKDTEIVHLSEDEKSSLRLQRIGFVFQQMNVLSDMNIYENIILPAKHANRKKKNLHDYEKSAKKWMEEFHILELAGRKVKEVSGGQLQRACICRSMIMEPEILFADEPTGALNQSSTKEVMNVFLELNQKGTSILMVTHDSKVASKCDRIVYILDGQIKGELTLGKWNKEEKERDQKVAKWLEEFGW